MNSALIERRNERFGSGVRLGVDPPISPERARQAPADHKRVSVKWLAGTVLTGVLGAGLVTAAIYAALDQRVRFAEPPQAPAPEHKPIEAEEEGPQTGDRLLQPVDIVAAKQTFKTPTTIKVGDKEVVRLKEFTRVSTTLVQADTGAAEVPPFDPLQLQKDSKNADQQPDPGPAPDDAEVSFVPRELDGGITADPTRTLSLEEVQAQVTEHLKNAIAAGNKPVLPIPSQLLLMRTSRAGVEGNAGMEFAGSGLAPSSSPFSSIEVRMVPENVTPVARSSGDAMPKQTELKLVTLKRGLALDGALKASGATPAQAHAIAAALGKARGGPSATEGQRVKLTLADMDGSGKMTVARVAVYSDDKLVATVALGDNGAYMPITDGAVAQTAKQQGGKGAPTGSGGLRLYDSLYQSALKQAISRPVIAELIKVFANDVDFQRPVGNGDSFETFYANAEQAEGRDELLFASITSHGETYRYYRFQTPDDGTVDYYDPTGRSTRKFLIRKPINGGEPTSPFGYRVHPILGYVRMHTGQDWGAATGTQIFAAGNGTVIKAGFSAGYGRHIEIQHAHGYVTTYSHMSGFARGVAEGARVRQGQVIGYVGTTGASTGSHLHYEVLINGRFVDPIGIKLPRTREFDGNMLGQFKHERERIDGLMAKAPSVGDVAPMVADVTH